MRDFIKKLHFGEVSAFLFQFRVEDYHKADFVNFFTGSGYKLAEF